MVVRGSDGAMPLRRCIDFFAPGCTQWVRSGSLCDVCRARRKRRRDADRSLSRRVTATATVCVICGEGPRRNDPWTLEHRVPVSAGGSSEPGNVAAAHLSCNSGKRDR